MGEEGKVDAARGVLVSAAGHAGGGAGRRYAFQAVRSRAVHAPGVSGRNFAIFALVAQPAWLLQWHRLCGAPARHGRKEGAGDFSLGRRCGAKTQEEQHMSDTVMGPFGRGEVNPYGQFFKGRSYLNMLTREGLPIGNVTFEPGCRNNWHIHHAEKNGGQILLCTAGRGYYQEWGREAQEMNPGDVINIPPEVKHWHGAAPDSWFSHLAIEVPGEDGSNEWLEPVDDAAYGELR